MQEKEQESAKEISLQAMVAAQGLMKSPKDINAGDGGVGVMAVRYLMALIMSAGHTSK